MNLIQLQTLIFRHRSFQFLFNECVDFIHHLGKKNIVVLFRSSEDYHKETTSTLAFKSSSGGRRYYEFDRTTVATDPANFLLLNNGQRFAGFVNSEEEVETLSVFFATQFALDILTNFKTTDNKLLDNYGYATDQPLGFFEKLYPLSNEINKIILLLKISIGKADTDMLGLEQHLHDLVRQLLIEQRYVNDYVKQLPFARLSTKIEIYKRLIRAKDYMDSCFSENISLSQLASIACMSEHHFLRHFKLVFGKTPHQYLTVRRLEEAKVLLKKTDHSVVKIISMIGFECPSNFSRIFKLYTSYTPRDF